MITSWVLAASLVALLVGALPLLADEDLPVEDAVVVPLPVGTYGPRGMPGDIIALRDGSLVLCYTRASSIAPPGKPSGIYARRSADSGATWGDEYLLVADPQPPSKQGYYCHPGFVRAPNGDILFSYIYASEAVPYYGHSYYRRSADELATFSEQFVLTPRAGYVLVHNAKLRVLSSGRIIAPAEYKKHRPSEADHNDYVCLPFLSDDNGYSWYPASNDVDILPVESQEPHCVELHDGWVLMVFRTYNGHPGRAYSADGGVTWSKGELIEELPMSKNASAITVDRVPSTGDLVMVWCSGEDPETGRRRTPLVLSVSSDDGATWGSLRKIASEPNDDYGYQSVTFVGDRMILSYHARDGLHVARIPVTSLR